MFDSGLHAITEIHSVCRYSYTERDSCTELHAAILICYVAKGHFIKCEIIKRNFYDASWLKLYFHYCNHCQHKEWTEHERRHTRLQQWPTFVSWSYRVEHSCSVLKVVDTVQSAKTKTRMNIDEFSRSEHWCSVCPSFMDVVSSGLHLLFTSSSSSTRLFWNLD